jgi:hypothetical protein
MAAFFVLEGQMLLAAIFMILGVFPLVTILVILILCVTGCTTYNTTSISIDNSAKNNFIGNPCGFYVNDHCLYIKKEYRNPNNPYKKEEWIK